MIHDIAKERHDMLVERIYDLKESVGKELADLRESMKETCAALREHADVDETRYREQQQTAQTVNTATKALKVGAGAVSALGLKELWGLFKH